MKCCPVTLRILCCILTLIRPAVLVETCIISAHSSKDFSFFRKSKSVSSVGVKSHNSFICSFSSLVKHVTMFFICFTSFGGVSGYDGELLSRLNSTALIKERWITKYVWLTHYYNNILFHFRCTIFFDFIFISRCSSICNRRLFFTKSRNLRSIALQLKIVILTE